jgi:signal transduction histidine kinase
MIGATLPHFRPHDLHLPPFHRVDTRLAGKATGVGLGLSIVEAIARAHGGSVSV